MICSEGVDRREFGEVEVCCGENNNVLYYFSAFKQKQ